MRISGGEAKGRTLKFPSGSTQRPTTDFLRETLFNLLGSPEDLVFLDLYAGSGSVGLEAASRKAKQVVFSTARIKFHKIGKPIAVLLMRHDATVISCNKWTPYLEEYCRSADVLVAAAGVPGLITAEKIKPGATVIDVGVNRVRGAGADGKLKTVGDVAFDQAARVAGHISPVPGGVGPVTVAMLLLNVVESAERRLK